MILPKSQSILDFAVNNAYSNLYHGFGRAPESIMTIAKIKKTHPLAHYPEKDVRYLVSEFDPHAVDELVLLPQKIDARWHTLYETIERIRPKVVVQATPVCWQLGPFLYRTCRALQVPVSVVSPRNLPVAKEIIAQVGADMVVSTPNIAQALDQELRRAGISEQIRSWHLVNDGNDAIPDLQNEIRMETHLFPGFPIASALHSRATDTAMFTSYPEYSFERDGSDLLITSLAPHALPFIRLRLPSPVAVGPAMLTQ